MTKENIDVPNKKQSVEKRRSCLAYTRLGIVNVFGMLCLSLLFVMATLARADEQGTSPPPSQKKPVGKWRVRTWGKLEPNAAREAQSAGLRLSRPARRRSAPYREFYKDQQPTADLGPGRAGEAFRKAFCADREPGHARHHLLCGDSTERFAAHPEICRTCSAQPALRDPLVGSRAGCRSGRHRPDPHDAHRFGQGRERSTELSPPRN